MGQKIMLEATSPVVNGNEVVVAAGDLFASMDDVPEGVPVKPVIVDVPDEKPAAKAETAPKPAPPKHPAK